MPAAEDFWLARSRGRVVPLDRALCLELLRAVSVGRVGYVTTEGPRILPVNYTLAEEHIVFRTLAYGEIAEHVLDQRVAFEGGPHGPELPIGLERPRDWTMRAADRG